MPAGAKARNHLIQVISTLPIFRMKSIASRFGARAVRNNELVTQLVANAVHKTYAPTFRADFSLGLET